ncbi:MAG: glycosyltransferase [Actinomycetes bacterium]
MEEVRLAARSPLELATVLGPQRVDHLVGTIAPLMQQALAGHSVINVNSTAAGGGVAEMLQVLLPLARGTDVDARWLVIDGDPEFFALTKRMHNQLHGVPGDGGGLGTGERAHYEAVMRSNFEELAAVVAPGDVVILHDPQTAGLADALSSRDIPVVWRCHVGIDGHNQWTEQAWEFLRPYLVDSVDAFVFTRESYAPEWVPRPRLHIIKPSLDPLAPKNQSLSAEEAAAVLSHVGIIDGSSPTPVPFVRSDGSPGRVDRFADMIRTGPPPGADAPLIVQVSRWDPLKDMAGVMNGFVDHVLDGSNAHLVLAGPVVTAIADDPEAADVLEQTWLQWRALRHHQRSRVQLVCLPMSDVEENAVIVNALQQHATVVVQKSLAEGFGLTVAEAMYKGTPVVASAVGGLVDQVVDGETGFLIDPPQDLAEFGDAVRRLVSDPAQARAMGEAGRARAIAEFLPDTSLEAWQQVLVTALSPSLDPGGAQGVAGHRPIEGA